MLPKSWIEDRLITEEARLTDPLGVQNIIGRSYYIFCLEQAKANIVQARMLVAGDVTEENHELPRIEALLAEAIDAS